MIRFYDLGIWLYHALASCLRFFNGKAASFATGRQHSFRLLEEYARQENKTTYWFHCASLGEFEQARPLMEYLKKGYPEIKIALSFFSPSGYEHQKDYAYAEVVFYLPRDTAYNARRLLQILNPCKVFFIKYEFWLHYIDASSEAGIPVYLVSALFRKEQVFFQWYGAIFRERLKKYSRIFVQDEASAALLLQLGIMSLVTGDTRFDRVLENKNIVQPESFIPVFKQDKKIVIAGSSWPEEEEILFSAYDARLNYKIILAPHDIKRKIAVPRTLRSVKFSEAEPGSLAVADVLIIDCIGKLASLYQYADVAIIGGGFRGALHNILEAAVFGMPVIYGPYTQKHPEAALMQKSEGGIVVSDSGELREELNRLFTDNALRILKGRYASEFVLTNAGATLKIVNEIKK